MAVEKDFELLDDYLANRMGDADKAAFEKTLQADPALLREQSLQQNLVAGLRKARAAELKSMLNAVPVPSPYFHVSVPVKIASWVLITGLTVSGIFFYYHQDAPAVTTPAPDTTKEQKAGEPVTQAQEPVAVDGSIATSKQKENESQTPVTAPLKSDATKSKRETTKPVAEAVPDQTTSTPGVKPLDVYDPSSETEQANPKEETVAATVETANIAKSSMEVVSIGNIRKYQFHYQIKNGRLFLYGTFERGLYEIIDLYNNNTRTLFLFFYKDSYYLLNNESETIKELKPITDPALLKKVKAFREKK